MLTTDNKRASPTAYIDNVFCDLRCALRMKRFPRSVANDCVCINLTSLKGGCIERASGTEGRERGIGPQAVVVVLGVLFCLG